jgi:hypothetical protein
MVTKSCRIEFSGRTRPDNEKQAGKVGRPKGSQKGSNLSFEDFKAMLLEALRTDDEVRMSVAMIATSRETDVFSAVVKCLESGHDQITDEIGKKFIFI